VTDIVLEAHELCRSFRNSGGKRILAVDHVSMTLQQGSLSVLTGPSGSGKTTLLSLLGCLDRATSGSLLFQDQDVSRASDVQLARCRRAMGFMFQDFALLPRLNLIDNIGYSLIPRGLSWSQRRKKALTLLERLELTDKQHQRPEQLSGGERQRLALARALAGDPKIIIADEPTSNLDRDSGQSVIHLLLEQVSNGRTVIIASHDQDVLSVATHLFPLSNGRTVIKDQQGSYL